MLSACETHAGRLASGDELLSLARAFLSSGADQVLATLWVVPDSQTADLVERFADHLTGGASASDALYLARRDYLAEARDRDRRPYYWAAWTLIGRAE